MKKVLLAGTAIIGMALMSTPAQAELNLDLGGLFRGYIVHADSNEAAVDPSLRRVDFRRDTEIHFTGESTLENGLTVGVHYENFMAGDAAANDQDEVYAYFSNAWGRVNFGSEDGAAYLLQVAAPSADSNVDGLRTYIQGTSTQVTYANLGAFAGQFDGLFDYDHSDFKNTDRITYLTPKFSGFQAGVSYAPEAGQNVIGNNVGAMAANNTVATTGLNTEFEDLWEASLRWDGEFEGFGISAGLGYSTADLEAVSAVAAPAAGVASDGLDTWNVGLNVSFSGFSFGAAYLKSETEVFDGAGARVTEDQEKETWIIGGAWDNGPWHFGVTYTDQGYDVDSAVAANNGEITSDRFTIGGGYTFGPGMTFRGTFSTGEYDTSGGANFVGGTIAGIAGAGNDFDQITLGTDIQF